MNDQTLREQWISGQKCEIYSISKDQWFTGKINEIFIDDEGEWLEIRYNRSCSKQVQRYSVNVRPHPKYYDKTKCLLLINGYIRENKLNFCFNIPHELNIMFFTFYWIGDDIMPDDDLVSDSDHDNDNDNDNNTKPDGVRGEEEEEYDSNSPSPESKDLAIEYLRKRLKETRRNKRNLHSFVYPATAQVRRTRKLWDISETKQIPKIQMIYDNDNNDIIHQYPYYDDEHDDDDDNYCWNDDKKTNNNNHQISLVFVLFIIIYDHI